MSGMARCIRAYRTIPRVTNIEGLNARNLTAEDIGAADHLHCLGRLVHLAEAGAGPRPRSCGGGSDRGSARQAAVRGRREAIGKGGRCSRIRRRAPDVAAELERWFVEDMGWESLGLIPSPIAGGDGNQEFYSQEQNREHGNSHDRKARRQGDGIASGKDGPVYVPFALPGETVAIARVKRVRN